MTDPNPEKQERCGWCGKKPSKRGVVNGPFGPMTCPEPFHPQPPNDEGWEFSFAPGSIGHYEAEIARLEAELETVRVETVPESYAVELEAKLRKAHDERGEAEALAAFLEAERDCFDDEAERLGLAKEEYRTLARRYEDGIREVWSAKSVLDSQRALAALYALLPEERE